MSEKVLVPYKSVGESKIVWVSVITALLGVLTFFGVAIPETWTPETIESFVGALLTVLGGILAFLRIFRTSQPLAVAGKLPAAPEKKI